jgi:hypothetical protein
MSHEEVSAAAWNALSSVTKASAEAAKAAISKRFQPEQAVAAAERAAARARSSSNLENINDAYQKSAGASSKALHAAGFLQTEARPRGRGRGRGWNRRIRHRRARQGHVQVHRDGDKTDVDIDEDQGNSLQQMTDDSSEEVQEASEIQALVQNDLQDEVEQIASEMVTAESVNAAVKSVVDRKLKAALKPKVAAKHEEKAKTEADNFFAKAKKLEDNMDAFMEVDAGPTTDAAPGAAPGADALLGAEGYGHRGHGRYGRHGRNHRAGHVQVHRDGEHTDVDVEEDQHGNRHRR